jgi:hypothetical protein
VKETGVSFGQRRFASDAFRRSSRLHSSFKVIVLLKITGTGPPPQARCFEMVQ